ncbi:MAG: hypothetical protein Q8L27_00420 [archaeon]|nr:hypothetical protein [archaeon]
MTEQENLEGIVKRFVEKGLKKSAVNRVVAAYLKMPLTLQVSDVAMQRISEVLTSQGYETENTCEGHGSDIPRIFLTCDNQEHLRHLAYLLANRRMCPTNFNWVLGAWSSCPSSNPDSGLYYRLSPFPIDRMINPKKDHLKLVQDLDILGIALLNYAEYT